MSSSDYTALRKLSQVNALATRQPSVWFDVNTPRDATAGCFVAGPGDTGPQGPIGEYGPQGPMGPTGANGATLFTLIPASNSSNDIVFPTSNSILKTQQTLSAGIVITNEAYNTISLTFSLKGLLSSVSAGITFDKGGSLYYAFSTNSTNYLSIITTNNANQLVTIPLNILVLYSDVYTITLTNSNVIFLKNGIVINQFARTDSK